MIPRGLLPTLGRVSRAASSWGWGSRLTTRIARVLRRRFCEMRQLMTRRTTQPRSDLSLYRRRRGEHESDPRASSIRHQFLCGSEKESRHGGRNSWQSWTRRCDRSALTYHQKCQIGMGGNVSLNGGNIGIHAKELYTAIADVGSVLVINCGATQQTRICVPPSPDGFRQQLSPFSPWKPTPPLQLSSLAHTRSGHVSSDRR